MPIGKRRQGVETRPTAIATAPGDAKVNLRLLPHFLNRVSDYLSRGKWSLSLYGYWGRVALGHSAHALCPF